MKCGCETRGKKLLTYVWPVPCGGELVLGAFEGELVMADWLDGRHHEAIVSRLKRCLKTEVVEETTLEKTPVIAETVAWLEDYFKGGREKPSMKLRFLGTAFQLRVWKELERIPYGETTTYGELAKIAGSPGAARAVGIAVGENPFSIIVPCHRVVGKDTSITGYGGGCAAKKALLALELGVDVQNLPFKDSKHSQDRI